MDHEELKARMMREAEAAIDEVLKRKPDAQAILLGEIEELAIRGGQAFREAVLKNLVEESSREERREEVSCARCGQAMHYKGKREKAMITEAGEVRIERDYYYCAACQAGFFPLG